MRLVQDESKVVYSDVKGEAIPFSIGDTAFVIGILRDKIYSDPIYAVVAEYLSNARDACSEIGKESDQMIVTLPTTLNPTFSIRDFGIGMSPERISDVFVKYGVSTKRQDNSQVGCWGLGCKAAWSYADSFIIESFFDGVHREYIADIGETKEGRLLCFKEEPTDEPNGVVIKVPVQNKDAGAFERAFVKATMLWDKKPQLANKRRGDYPTLVFEYKKLKIYRHQNYGREFVEGVFLNASGLPFRYEFTSSLPVLRGCLREDYRFAAIDADPTKMGISANREGFSNQEYAASLCKKTYDELVNHIQNTLNATPFEEHIDVIQNKFFNIRYIVRAAFYGERKYSLCMRVARGLSLEAGYFLKVERNSTFLDSMLLGAVIIPDNVYFLTKSAGTRQYSTASYKRRSKEITPLIEPITKKAIAAIKKENTLRERNCEPQLKIRILFQDNLSDSDYQEVAKIVGATQYVEDVYSASKVKVSRSPKKNEPLKVRLFTKSYTRWCRKSHPQELADFLNNYEAIFYDTTCSSDAFDGVHELKPLVDFNIALVHATSAQITQLEKLKNPKLQPLSEVKKYIISHPRSEALADYRVYKRSSRLWDWFLEESSLSSQQFDLTQLREKIAHLKKLDARERLHIRMEVPEASSIFTKVTLAYPLLVNVNHAIGIPEVRSDLIFYINKKDQGVLDA